METPELLSALQSGLESSGVATEGLEYSGPITGGIVNTAALFKTERDKYLVKWNTKPCVCRDHTETGGLHAIEFIDSLQPVTRWRDMATATAKLHSINLTLQHREKKLSGYVGATSDDVDEDTQASLKPVYKFGCHVSPYIGNFTPGAVWRDTWEELLIRDIMQGLFDMLEKQYGDREAKSGWAELQRHVHKIFKGITIHPQLLHGDFCPANLGQTGTDIVMFDPSCLYGDPDYDLLIAVNEPGVEQDFFTTYRALLPPVGNFDVKMSLYKLMYNLAMWCHVDDDVFKEGTLTGLKEVNQLVNQL